MITPVVLLPLVTLTSTPPGGVGSGFVVTTGGVGAGGATGTLADPVYEAQPFVLSYLTP